ncbi:hypothetical protein GFL02_01430 [Pseudomonas stutzeri]|nr:hypothetical protein [Stutzerimonas frequens]MBK3870722.1 hypothetical protein [Stutzerimonas frequens]MBK3909059.1 hypothetical protein [Stutzerimonas frequens]MBK3929338.1 hypothetical protein [Stutzerimonas frequens]
MSDRLRYSRPARFRANPAESFLQYPRFLDLDQSLRAPGIGILRPLTRVNFFPITRVYLAPIEQRIRFRR